MEGRSKLCLYRPTFIGAISREFAAKRGPCMIRRWGRLGAGHDTDDARRHSARHITQPTSPKEHTIVSHTLHCTFPGRSLEQPNDHSHARTVMWTGRVPRFVVNISKILSSQVDRYVWSAIVKSNC